MGNGKKITVFLDADDTILKSSETVIDILNQKYQITPRKTIENLKEWNYRSIYKWTTEEEINEIYASKEFFDNVKFNEEFVSVYEKYKDVFNFCVVTKGTQKNLARKREKVVERFPEMGFIGIRFITKEATDFEKNSVNMRHGIQIDDRLDCLQTNAAYKILLRNGLEVPWNNYQGNNMDNLYVVDNWKQIEEVFAFAAQHPEMVRT